MRFIYSDPPVDGPCFIGGAKGMNVAQLAWNAIETNYEVACFFSASPSPCADGERGRFREATVENEGYIEDG